MGKDLNQAILETHRWAKEVLAGHLWHGGPEMGLNDWMAEECLIRLEGGDDANL